MDHNSLEILDVNDCAIEFYGYSIYDFIGKNIYDLGERKDRQSLLNIQDASEFSEDIVWEHRNHAGQVRFIQFTTHTFNYREHPAMLAVAHDVTEQVEQQEIRSNRYPKIEMYRGDRPLAEVTWNGEGVVKKWSQKAEALFGWTKEDVIDNPEFMNMFIHEDEQEEAQKLIDEKMADGERSFTVSGKVRTKSGEMRICEWHNTFFYDETGELERVYSLLQDISERKQQEHLFRALSEKSLVGVYLIQDNEFKYVNPRFAEIFGYEKEEIEGRLGPLDLAHPDDRAEVDENLRRRLSGEVESLKYDFRCVTKDGDTIHVKVFGTRMVYLGRMAVVGTLLDITHSKLAFERYQSSVESFEDLFDSISDAIYIQNRDAEFIKVNEAAVALNGYSREELIGRTPDFLAAPGKVDLNETHEYFDKALKGTPQKFEQWGIRKSGEVFPEEVVLNPGTYFGEDVVIAISRDITDRHEVKDEMQRSREKFQQLFSNAPIGIVMMDKHQEIRAINKAFEDIFGYEQGEIEGIDIDRLIVPDEEREGAQRISDNIFAGQSASTTARRKRKDGSFVEVLVYGVPVILNERTIAIFGIYVDITERKQANERIKKSLKEKEVLLAEIHHRVKNNLAVITGLLELQQYNTELDEAKEILKESQLRINSIALIHEKLYQNENLSQISIDVYLNELIDIITNSMRTEETDVAIHVEADAAFLTINQAIPCGLILNELITNAYKHAFHGRDKGNVTIRLVKHDRNVHFAFEDDGTGIPESVNLEAPSSLGLTLIQTLSRQLQGEYCFQRLEKGSRFELNFRIDD